MAKDYCTLFPDGCWAECCKLHDRRYSNKRLSKFQADKLLYRCVSKKSNFIIGAIIFLGVSIFGWYFYNKGKKNG